MPIVVFDLEGVLIDNRKRLKYALAIFNAKSIEDIKYPQRSRFWKVFLNPELAEKMDNVNILGLKILADRSKNCDIVIISGTRKEIALIHVQKLNNVAKNMGLSIKIDRLFYRRSSREKAPEFKERILRLLMLEDEIIEFHDDNEDVLKRVKKYGIKCYIWRDLRPERY